MLKKRTLSLLLVLAMIFTGATGIVFATDEVGDAGDETAAVEVVKADQAVEVDAAQKVVLGKTKGLGDKLVTGDGAVTYKSSDRSVATVNKEGVVRGKKVGTCKITIKVAETENYAAFSTTVTLKVIPKAVAIQSLFSNKYARFTVKWASIKGVDGFQVKYSKDKTFKTGVKYKLVKNGKARHTSVSKVQRVKRYYVKVRTYKVVNGVKYFSKWSKAKSVKIK